MAAPGGHGPVGPYPDGVDTDEQREEYDRQRRRVLRSLPYGLYVVGSRAGVRRNAMTLNWATQVSFEPKLVGIGVEKTALTHELITQGGVFSLCTIAREDRTIVRKFTKPVDVDLAAATLNGFAFVEATTGAPILAQAVGWLDCRVTQPVDCANHTFFIGEVVNAGFRTGQGDNAPEGTPLLRMEDTSMAYGG